MTNSVNIFSGKVHTVNGIKESTQLQVSIPSGMTGKQLKVWKAKNENQIVQMCESGTFGTLSAESDDVDGDRLLQW